MTDKELLDFCKNHNVELSFCFETQSNIYHLRMRRGMFQINDILSVEKIQTAKEWAFLIKAVLTSMVAKLNKFEKEHEDLKGDNEYEETRDS